MTLSLRISCWQIPAMLTFLWYVVRSGLMLELSPSDKITKPLYVQIYLCDFGLSKFATPREVMSIARGTLAYMAPEILLMEGYTKAVDVWGVGVLAYIL